MAPMALQKKIGFTPEIDLILELKSWENVPALTQRIKDATAATVLHLPLRYKFPFQVNLLLTGDAQIRRLNHDFRGIDKATNVLSFPQLTVQELGKIARKGKDLAAIPIGDIALAYRTSKKEAIENNELFENHVIHLVIHGLLHLFGYDHMIDREAEVMESLEVKIMKSLGLPDPYVTARPHKKRMTRPA